MIARRWIPYFLGLLAWACADASGPSAEQSTLDLEFTVLESSMQRALGPILVQLDASNRLEVEGSFETPCLHYTASAAGLRRTDTLQLTVTAYLPGPLCQTAIGVLGFNARFPPLLSGTYHLRVIRAFKSWPWPPQTLVEGTVAIP